jgi:hypothetical protein
MRLTKKNAKKYKNFWTRVSTLYSANFARGVKGQLYETTPRGVLLRQIGGRVHFSIDLFDDAENGRPAAFR